MTDNPLDQVEQPSVILESNYHNFHPKNGFQICSSNGDKFLMAQMGFIKMHVKLTDFYACKCILPGIYLEVGT